MSENDNLPPGINVSDIPGNRPEDEFWDQIINELCDVDLDPVFIVKLVKVLAPVIKENSKVEYRRGYEDGKDDVEAKHREREEAASEEMRDRLIQMEIAEDRDRRLEG